MFLISENFLRISAYSQCSYYLTFRARYSYKQAEAEVVPSSSLVELEVEVGVKVGVEAGAEVGVGVGVEVGVGDKIGLGVEVGVGAWVKMQFSFLTFSVRWVGGML